MAQKKQAPLSKDNSILEMSRKLNIKTISESEVTFNAGFTPLMFGVYRIKVPFNIFLTVVPQKAKPDNNSGTFRAVINGIGEEQKGVLRQFINEVYFRELEESKKEDKETLDKIKEAYATKKAEEIKKAEEAKQKTASVDVIDQLVAATSGVEKKGD